MHASLLKVGDRLTEDDGGTLTVTDVTFDPDAPINLTYNLEVTEFHTYFVGEDGVLVHNGKGWPAELQGLMDEITKREHELEIDQCSLPEFGGGPNKDTRQGHRRILKFLWRKFYEKLDKFDPL